VSVIGYIFTYVNRLRVLDDVLEGIRFPAGKAELIFRSAELLIGSRPDPFDRRFLCLTPHQIVPTDLAELNVLSFRFAQRKLPLSASLASRAPTREQFPHP